MPHPNLHPNPALEARLARRGPLSLSKWGGVSLQSLLSPVGRNNHALSANATQWRARRGRNGWRRIGSSQARFMRPPEQRALSTAVAIYIIMLQRRETVAKPSRNGRETVVKLS